MHAFWLGLADEDRIEPEPEEIVPQQKLLERAQGLRDGARSGSVTPLVTSELPVSETPANLGLPGQGLPGGQPLPYEPLPGPPPVQPNMQSAPFYNPPLRS